MSWQDFAACKATLPSVFFEDAEAGGTEAVVICAMCPVRGECLEAALADEEDAAPTYRFGVRGGLTPALRYTVATRARLRCRSCNALHDPIDLANGILRCTAFCGETPARAFRTDNDYGPWLPRLTGLGHLVISWVSENVAQGEQLPSPTALARSLKQRKEDTVRVYQALVEDAFILRSGRSKYVRGHVTFSDPQAWIPLVLRHEA